MFRKTVEMKRNGWKMPIRIFNLIACQWVLHNTIQYQFSRMEMSGRARNAQEWYDIIDANCECDINTAVAANNRLPNSAAIQLSSRLFLKLNWDHTEQYQTHITLFVRLLIIRLLLSFYSFSICRNELLCIHTHKLIT